MAVTVNTDKTFKCRHGRVFATAQEAAACDLRQSLANLLTKDESCPYLSKKCGPLEMIGEATVLVHWITKHPDKLEGLIRDYLDSSAVGVKMPRPVPAEKKAGEA